MRTDATTVIKALAITLTVVMACSATANSRFTIVNDSSNKISVDVYNGGDKLCGFPAKSRSIGPGNEQSIGCNGDGKHRCKVLLSMRKTDDEWPVICKDMHTACQNEDETIILKNKSTMTVSGDSPSSATCVISED